MDPTHNQSLEALDRARVMHPNTDLRAFAAMDPTHNQSLEALDRARVMHPNTDLRAFAAGELGDPTIVTGADGLRIRDRKG